MALTLPQIISPIDIATNGLLATVAIDRTQSGGPQLIVTPALTIATMGWIVFLEEEIVEVPEKKGGRKPPRVRPGDKRKKKFRKKITCRVQVDNEWYTDVAYTDDLKLNLRDVRVKLDLDEQKKPIIEIILPEVKNGRD